MMQVKLEHLMLLVTDEISMVGFDFFQQMNEVVTSVKGMTGGNWGNICMLAVGDLFQLPPVASVPVYVSQGVGGAVRRVRLRHKVNQPVLDSRRRCRPGVNNIGAILMDLFMIY